MQTPSVIFVTGLAATGKTTLAEHFSRELRLPLFTKDRFKEPMYEALGAPERTEQHRAQGALAHRYLNELCAELVRAGVSHILEAPFSDSQFTPFLRELRSAHPFRTIQIALRCEGETLLRRFIEREQQGRTHPGHQGLRFIDSIRDRLLAGGAPLSVEGPLLEIDTTDFAGVDVGAVTEWVRGQLLLA